MASQAYYRKWRSQTFAELVGQEHVTRTLLNAVRGGRVAHAYVFSGPRGVGKTSAARLLAKAVNCQASADGEPCNACESCRAIAEGRAMDIIELDAASNRGIDDIRDLREKVNFAPSEFRYKLYILDEAHMLTTEAVNAFLKTLEEPPAHTVFVLATTEPHRLPATILSRCQHLEFRRIALPAMLTRLRQICQMEGVEVEPAALEMIARGATGSLRDAEGLLEQLVAYAGQRIGVEQVRAIVGLGGSEAARQLLVYLANGDLAGGLRLINQLIEAGADPRHFGREVVDYLRGLMLLKAGDALADLLDVTPETLAQMRDLARRLSSRQVLQCIRIFAQSDPPARGASLGQLPLEMAFVEASLALGAEAREAEPTARPTVTYRTPEAPTRQAARTARGAPDQPPGDAPAPRQPSTSEVEPLRPAGDGSAQPGEKEAGARPADGLAATEPAAEQPVTRAAEPATRRRRSPPPEAERTEEEAEGTLSRDEVEARWREVVERFGASSKGKSIQALLRDVRPVDVQDATVVLGCRFPFHRDRLNEDRTRAAVETVLGQVLGRRCRARFVLNDSEVPKEVASPADPFHLLMDDMLVKGAYDLGWRVRRVVDKEEVVYDAQPQDDTAAPGQAGQDPGGAG